MNPRRDAARAYLLGLDAEPDRDRIEQEYFRDPDALAEIEAAEEALIEDYLAGALRADERARFEQHYLASPHHRTRLATIQRLTDAAGRAAASPRAVTGAPERARFRNPVPLVAVAAGLTVAVGAGLWLAERSWHARGLPTAPALSVPAAPGSAKAATPLPPIVAFTWSVSPLSVRGASNTSPLVIPAGATVVTLQLEAEANAPPIARGRVVIRTVAGGEVWQNPIAAVAGQLATIAAIAAVPADRLPADDYTITLFETGASGIDVERSRYFLRVRAR